MTTRNPTWVAQDFRFAEDTGAAGSSWIDAENTGINRTQNQSFRLRIAVGETNNANTANVGSWVLQAIRNGGTPFTVTTSSTYVKSITSAAAEFVDGSTVTQNLGGVTGSATYQSSWSEQDENGSTGSQTWTDDDTEYEYALQLVACAVGDTITFRMLSPSSSTAVTFSNVPTITVVAHTSTGALTAQSATVDGSGKHSGILYWVVGPSSGWTDPSATQVKSGLLGGGGAATDSGSEKSPITTTDPFTFASGASGLTQGAAYKDAIVWSDGTTDSNVAVSAEWTTTAGATTHAATGALSAQSATVDGAGKQWTAHSSTGALDAQSATVDGSGKQFTAHSSTGALDAQSATVDGAGKQWTAHDATGALDAQAATVDGSGKQWTAHDAAGALLAQDATTDGSGAVRKLHAGTGDLTAQAATVDGAGKQWTAHDATGALDAQPASVDGSGKQFTAHDASGALGAQDATVDGAGKQWTAHAATGELTAQAATVDGDAARTGAVTVHDATGALEAQSATVDGTGKQWTAHDATGALTAQDATTDGAGKQFTAHAATGALSAQSATTDGSGAVAATVKISWLEVAPGHVATGALSAQDATVDGAGKQWTAHDATGSLGAQDAQIDGSGARFTGAVTHDATGDLQAQDAQVDGAGELTAAEVGRWPPEGHGRKRRRRRHVVEINGRIRQVADEGEARAVLAEVKAQAEAAAQLAQERAQAATKRPLRKVLADVRKAVEIPTIRVPDFSGLAEDVLHEIRELKRSTLRDVEIALRLRELEQDRDDEEALLLLL